jgi:hypothetical protein
MDDSWGTFQQPPIPRQSMRGAFACIVVTTHPIRPEDPMPLMIVYHGTTRKHAEDFVRNGINAHLPFPRLDVGPLAVKEPGLFVAPTLEVARRFGDRSVVSIEVDASDLQVPPNLKAAGCSSVAEALANPLEPQAFLAKRIEPCQVKLVYREEPQDSRRR